MTAASALVNTLTDQLAEVLMRAATEALSESQCRRLRVAVERHLWAGRLDTARALVADEIMAACLTREISRHLFDCPMCGEDDLRCYVLGDMERRETVIHERIAQAGGF